MTSNMFTYRKQFIDRHLFDPKKKSFKHNRKDKEFVGKTNVYRERTTISPLLIVKDKWTTTDTAPIDANKQWFVLQFAADIYILRFPKKVPKTCTKFWTITRTKHIRHETLQTKIVLVANSLLTLRSRRNFLPKCRNLPIWNYLSFFLNWNLFFILLVCRL